MKLVNLLNTNEIIAKYHLHNEYCVREAIMVKGRTDISSCLEETLHRILENGGTEEDVYKIMGAYIPSESELQELDEFGEYLNIDLGYILPGLIDVWEEQKEESKCRL